MGASSYPTQTHELVLGHDEVVKTYRQWERGEPDREWRLLGLLARHAPGLAPMPLRYEASPDGRPRIVMTRLPGRPLGTTSLTPRQVDGLAGAWRAVFGVPVAAAEAVGVGQRLFGPLAFPEQLRGWVEAPAVLDACVEPAVVAEALDAARSWLGSARWPDVLVDPVVTPADGNLANALWDGARCRLVDFEDAGISDIAFEVAGLAEHASVRLRELAPVDALVSAAALTPEQRSRCDDYRRLMAVFWLTMLLPDGRGFQRNPRGSTEWQARRVLGLLGRPIR